MPGNQISVGLFTKFNLDHGTIEVDVLYHELLLLPHGFIRQNLIYNFKTVLPM